MSVVLTFLRQFNNNNRYFIDMDIKYCIKKFKKCTVKVLKTVTIPCYIMFKLITRCKDIKLKCYYYKNSNSFILPGKDFSTYTSVIFLCKL